MKNRIVRLALVVLAVAGQAAAGFFVFQRSRRCLGEEQPRRAHARHRPRAVDDRRDPRRARRHGRLRPGPRVLGAEGGRARAGRDRQAQRDRRRPHSSPRPRRTGRQPSTPSPRSAGRPTACAISSPTISRSPLQRSRSARRPQHLSTASGALANIAPTQAAAVEREVSRLRLLEAYALLGAAGFTLLVLLVLLPRARMPESESAGVVTPAMGLGLSLGARHPRRTLTPWDRAGSTSTSRAWPAAQMASRCPNASRARGGDRQRPAARVAAAAEHRGAGGPGGNRPAVRRPGADEGCVGAAGYPRPRGRAARRGGHRALDCEPDGGSALRPAASHGYSEHTMAKMKALPVSAENAVSVAFRSGRIEIVRGTRDRNGAIVAPINAASGLRRRDGRRDSPRRRGQPVRASRRRHHLRPVGVARRGDDHARLTAGGVVVSG